MDAQDGLPNLRWFRPSPLDWEDFRDIIIDLYTAQEMPLSRVMSVMRYRYGFGGTKRMYVQYLHKWNAHKYKSLEEKNALCDRVLDDYRNGRDLSYLTPKDIRKLLRHCREAQIGLDVGLPRLLKSLQDSASLPSTGETVQQEPIPLQQDTSNQSLSDQFDNTSLFDGQNPGSALVAQAVPTYFIVEESSTSGSASGPSTPGSSYTQSAAGSNPELLMHPSGEETASRSNQSYPTSIDEQVPRPRLTIGGLHAELEGLLFLTRNYYTTRLEEYKLAKWAAETSITRSEAMGFEQADAVELGLSRAEVFWTDVKSAIYFLKTREDKLAWPLLQKAGNQCPQLSHDQPFTLLRDIFATLSTGNTSICPGLRASLLKLFIKCIPSPNGPNDPLRSICTRLQEEWICDEVLATALSLISRCAEQMLPAGHGERFELRRTLVRMVRRQKDFANAESIAWRTINDMELQLGKKNVKTRLARTELVYILNDQGQLDRALDIAEDIVHRGRQDEGVEFPTKRSVYAMEDVAEIYQWLGKKEDAALWLRRALKGAWGIWGRESGTIHIMNKLEALRAEGG